MTTQCFELPKARDVGQLFDSLLGLDLVVKDDPSPDLTHDRIIVTYVDDKGQPSAVAACDFAFANGVGAALARIPATAAAESTKLRDCPENLKGNFVEVMNVGANMLTNPKSSRMALRDVQLPPHATPPQPTELKASFKFDLGSYGVGSLLLWLIEN